MLASDVVRRGNITSLRQHTLHNACLSHAFADVVFYCVHNTRTWVLYMDEIMHHFGGLRLLYCFFMLTPAPSYNIGDGTRSGSIKLGCGGQNYAPLGPAYMHDPSMLYEGGCASFCIAKLQMSELYSRHKTAGGA